MSVPVLHFGFHPVQQSLPVFAAEEDERELRDALGLHEGHDFEKFVERAEATGHVNEAEAVFGKADFARKEVVKVQRDVGEAVAACSCGNSMLRPTDLPPPCAAPLLAASMMPGPPPVMTAN